MGNLNEIRRVNVAIAKREARWQKLRELRPALCKLIGPEGVEHSIEHGRLIRSSTVLSHYYATGEFMEQWL